jgi:uracil-DNA glycosylase
VSDLSDEVVAKRMREMRRRGKPPMPVLMGEAPSKSGDRYHMFPLSGRVAETLCAMAGIPPMAGESRYGQWTWALYDRFECMNLIERWPGAQGSGSAFPMEAARAALVERLPEIEGRVVVLLGARLPKLLMPKDTTETFYRWEVATSEARASDGEVVYVAKPTTMCAIPHPSGLNRMYNAVVERERAGAILRQAMDYARIKAELGV